MRKIHFHLFLVLFLPVFMMSGCQGKKTVFEAYNKFERLSWNRFDNQVFTTEITDLEPSYDLFIHIRHLPEINYKVMLINFTINTPSGDMRTTDYTLSLRDADGNLLGKCMGDYCDLEIPLRKDFRFSETGKVRFEIENKYTKVEMPGILEVGFIIRESAGE